MPVDRYKLTRASYNNNTSLDEYPPLETRLIVAYRLPPNTGHDHESYGNCIRIVYFYLTIAASAIINQREMWAAWPSHDLHYSYIRLYIKAISTNLSFSRSLNAQPTTNIRLHVSERLTFITPLSTLFVGYRFIRSGVYDRTLYNSQQKQLMCSRWFHLWIQINIMFYSLLDTRCKFQQKVSHERLRI